MRLDKLLAHVGYGTRKEVKKLIRQKEVYVNGVVVTKDDFKVDETRDKITIYDEEVVYQKYVYIMLNKSAGYISTTVDEQYPTVIDLIAEYYVDLAPVGRLDLDTEGLLLLTNDGQFSHQITSNKRNVSKVYYLELESDFDPTYISEIEAGIWLNDEEQALPAKVEVINENSLYLTITEGKFHQVKRMMHACQNEVTYLKRIKIGNLSLDEELEVGDYRFLTEEEKVAALGK